MMPFTRTLEPEKHQLQELNSKLAQYLTRTKQLEVENASLSRELSELRRAKSAQRDAECRAEVRELRRTAERLAAERRRAEMEAEKLRRELESARGMCGEQTGVCREVTAELRGCEQELSAAQRENAGLQQRLQRLEEERTRAEEAHRHGMLRLRRQAETRTTAAHPPHLNAQSSSGLLHPPVTAEDVQDLAFGLSEGWVRTLDMYQQKVEQMEQALREERAQMCDLRREREASASQLQRVRAQAEQQGQQHARLKQELLRLQEKFHLDSEEYQMVIDHLQRERDLMAHNMEQKMVEHQQLLQLKMDLGLELAAYRALLEGERMNLDQSHRKANQPRERIIEIKMPSQTYSPRGPPSVRHYDNFRPSPAAPSYRRPPVPWSSSGPLSPSRVVPIAVSRNQSPAARRDMISFTKSRADQSSTTTTKGNQPDVKAGAKVAPFNSPIPKNNVERKVLSTTTSKRNAPESGEETNQAFDLINHSSAESSMKKTLNSESVEDMIEKVIKKAGSAEDSGESKVRYHVEKVQDEDGTTKTRIVLESKVEEELEISQDSDLKELLNQGTKKMSLEDIKDTATASMIKNLLREMKEGDDLGSKSINVEIVEEPVESLSDDDDELEMKKQMCYQGQASPYFQIEELENAPTKSSNERWKDGSGQVEEVSRESDSSQEKRHGEYFVSTPDDFSEMEGCGITSYGHYGIVDDLSDERYYQDEMLPFRATPEESEEYKYMTRDRPSFKDGFPECIIEEEVRVSPIVQESVLEFLREDSLEPKDQLKGALEKLQESVSGPLREELAYLTKISRESPDKVAVDVRKVEQSSNDGTMTIVAELNVSQTLEESGLLDESGDLSEEQIMAALRGSGLEKMFQSGAGGGYSIKVSTEEDRAFGDISEKDMMEKLMRGDMSYSYGVQGDSEEEPAGGVESQPGKVKEKRIVYLESPSED